jgi:hypothetical protein
MRVPETGEIVIFNDPNDGIKKPMIVTSLQHEGSGRIAGWAFNNPAVENQPIRGVEYCDHGGLPGEWEWPTRAM